MESELRRVHFNRVFEVEGDPKGQPLLSYNEQRPVLTKSSFRPVIPRTTKTHNLEDCQVLESFPQMTPEASVILIRAARFYQDALWLADSETALSWLMLVSAVETAANHLSKEITPIEKLKEFKEGELYRVAKNKGGDEFAEQIANLTTDFMGSTKKFVNFILKYLPEPISPREDKYWQHSWETKDIKKTLSKIYDYRSKALHAGIPFPYPMCLPPREVEKDLYAELPEGLGISARGATWVAKDTPMLLHVFEHIVRNCLLKWWRSMEN